MASTLSNAFKTLYLIFFTFNVLLIFPALDNNLFEFENLTNIFGLFIDLFSAFAAIVANIAGFAGSIYLGSNAMQVASNSFTEYIQAIIPTVTTNTDPTVFIDNFILSIGVLITVILIPMAILSAIGFVFRGETKLSVYSFVAFILLLSLAMYTQNLNMDLSMPDKSDFISILTAPIFIVALSLYLMLEFSFQAAYVIGIMDPMQEREKRIKQHLIRISNYVPTIVDEGQTTRVSSQQTRKFGVLAASYMREMVEKKVFKRGQAKMSDKAMMRLQGYVSNLKALDREFEYKITARSAQPEVGKIVRQLIPTMTFRITSVVLISIFIINPYPFLSFLQDIGLINFPQLLDSLELTQPEFSTLIVFNVVLVIILLGSLFSYINKNLPMEAEIQRIDTLVEFSEDGLDSRYSTEDDDEEDFDDFDED